MSDHNSAASRPIGLANAEGIARVVAEESEQRKNALEERLESHLDRYGALAMQLGESTARYDQLSQALGEEPELVIDETWWMGVLEVLADQKRVIEQQMQITTAFIYETFDVSYAKVAKAAGVSRALIPKWIEKAKDLEIPTSGR